MHSAPTLPPRRLGLLPVALVVLLHWIALTLLLDVHLTLPQAPATPVRESVLAQLLPGEAPPPLPAPEPVPVPDPGPPPLPVVPPVPVELALPATPGDITPGAGTAIAGNGPSSGGVAPPAAPAPPASPPPPAPPAPEPPAPAAPLATPAEPEPRRYVVDMPPPAKITLDVARTDADGTEWTGEALLAWQLNEDSYKIQFEAGIRVVFTRVNLAVLNSEGAVAVSGFAPIRMTEKRRGRSLTATHFNWGTGRLSFSGSQANYPLVPGAQDKASVPLQLSAIARGDVRQLHGDIDILVGEDRDAAVYRFKVIGQETIDTKIGKLQTWHLSRPPQPGSYKSKLDIWLAPEHGWYPVRIRNSEANGAVTTQTVNNIVLNHSGS